MLLMPLKREQLKGSILECSRSKIFQSNFSLKGLLVSTRLETVPLNDGQGLVFRRHVKGTVSQDSEILAENQDSTGTFFSEIYLSTSLNGRPDCKPLSLGKQELMGRHTGRELDVWGLPVY